MVYGVAVYDVLVYVAYVCIQCTTMHMCAVTLAVYYLCVLLLRYVCGGLL